MEKKDYSYALFFGHLALEKILKSLNVFKVNQHAPLMHNLIRLAEEAGLALEERQMEVLAAASTFNIESRYPDIKRSFRALCTMEFADEKIKQIKEMFQWLRMQIPSN
jgi:HEPN domain-containing protein